MNKKKIYVSLYILIPLIFAGLSMITVILTYQITHSAKADPLSSTSLFALLALTGIISFSLSLIVLRIILRPVIQFVSQAQKMPIFTDPVLTTKKNMSADMGQITNIFDKVTNILTHVEAKELFPRIIGSSSSMRSIFTRIIKIAPTDSTVLISGESGTGKDLIASSIYEHSLRNGKPFIAINCVAIPEGLLESELFGHEKGSFTGAIALKKGKFEIANGGTIFLDEIGDMPLATQAKLLRVLQEKEFERVGGTATIKVDVRFIAATNKNLQKMITEGTFREDLFFRLNVFSIELPPLRERRDDIVFLANFFLQNNGKEIQLSPQSLQILIGYSWPGNIRELKNVLEQASVLCENGTIEPRNLPEVLLKQSSMPMINNLNGSMPLDEKIGMIEKEIIVSALMKTGGIQIKAANILGINQRSLWHRIKKLNIDTHAIKKLQ
jgi:transcriptional regulator with PAS, ATPase and Fis domain